MDSAEGWPKYIEEQHWSQCQHKHEWALPPLRTWILLQFTGDLFLVITLQQFHQYGPLLTLSRCHPFFTPTYKASHYHVGPFCTMMRPFYPRSGGLHRLWLELTWERMLVVGFRYSWRRWRQLHSTELDGDRWFVALLYGERWGISQVMSHHWCLQPVTYAISVYT